MNGHDLPKFLTVDETAALLRTTPATTTLGFAALAFRREGRPLAGLARLAKSAAIVAAGTAGRPTADVRALARTAEVSLRIVRVVAGRRPHDGLAELRSQVVARPLGPTHVRARESGDELLRRLP